MTVAGFTFYVLALVLLSKTHDRQLARYME